MQFRLITPLLTIFFAFTLTASAQVPISVGGLELTASTDNPVPEQLVTITAKSYILDIDSARVSWTVDGVPVKSGVGLTTLEIKAPELGKKTSVGATIDTPDGRTVRASIQIGSGSIDLIVETDGYIPPFFPGKISPKYQNTVTVIAVPHIANSAGVEYDPKSLTYEWRRNDRVLEAQSGYGKQSISLVGDLVPRPYELMVSVWPRDNASRAQALTQISFDSPYIGFYIDDPQYGPLFNIAAGDNIRIGSQKETSVMAVPSGFNIPSNGIGGLSWSWLINGSKRDELTSKESVVLRAPESSAGASDVQLDIRNPVKILQGVVDGFTVTFGKQDKSDGNQVSF